jgi:hypothetical protein
MVKYNKITAPVGACASMGVFLKGDRMRVHPNGRMALIQGYMLGMKSNIPPSTNRDNLAGLQIAMIRIERAINEVLQMLEADIPPEEIYDPRDNMMMQKQYPN